MDPNPPALDRVAKPARSSVSEQLSLLPRVLRPVGGKRFMLEKGIGGGSYIVEK